MVPTQFCHARETEGTGAGTSMSYSKAIGHPWTTFCFFQQVPYLTVSALTAFRQFIVFYFFIFFLCISSPSAYFAILEVSFCLGPSRLRTRCVLLPSSYYGLLPFLLLSFPSLTANRFRAGSTRRSLCVVRSVERTRGAKRIAHINSHEARASHVLTQLNDTTPTMLNHTNAKHCTTVFGSSGHA